MSPQCKDCYNIIDAHASEARQGSTIPCPYCGKDMKIHYTFKESITDPEAWIKTPGLRASKYVSEKRLIFYGLIILIIIVAYILMGAF